MHQIRVLVVEDSLVFRRFLVHNLERDPFIRVVAEASNPYEARDAIIEYKPDVMTLDLELPEMNGMEFLRKLIPQYPIPVVVISALSEKVFEALSVGAVDFVVKPTTTDQRQLSDFVDRELPDKIKAASYAKVERTGRVVMPRTDNLSAQPGDAGMLIAIGASTGGTEAIAALLQEFGPDVPGIVIVQHMPPGFTAMYARRLDAVCGIRVREARTGDAVRRGQALIAPGGDSHMSVVKVGGEYQVVCRKGCKVNGHCPSVDVLFQSIAETVGKNAIGIILTGMGVDGARGLLAMRRQGARTIGQEESTCVVYGMPKAAYELGAVEYQEKLSDIAGRTYSMIRSWK